MPLPFEGDKDRRESVVLVLVFNAGFGRHIGKSAVAVVVEQVVGLALQAARAAVDGGAAVLAEGIAHGFAAGDGQVVAVEVDVAGDVEIEQAVSVVVAPGRAGRPVAERYAGCFRNISEGSVVIVVVEAVLAVVAHIDVRPAVVVVVGDADAVAPAVIGDAGLRGDIGKRAVVVVAEEGGVRRGFLAVECVEGGAVDQVDGEPAAVVVVDEADARSHWFQR